jgi:hypothetical protein
MISGLMRAVGMVSKVAPRITRGIGQAVAVTRKIGEGARQIQNIGQAVNDATGIELQNNNLYNKAMQVAGKVEQGAGQAENYAPKIQQGVNRAQALASQYS